MIRRAVVFTALLLATLLSIRNGELHASPLRQTSALAERTVFYQRTLTLPVSATHSQRTLLAASLAATELQDFDPQKFEQAYRAGLAVLNYRPLSDTTWTWDTDHWVYEMRTTYTYNGEAFPIEVVAESWDGSKWVNQGRFVTEYNGSGRQTSIVTQFWTGSDWQNASRSLFEYDGSGNPSVTTFQNWNASSQVWVSQSRTLTTYGASHLLESSTSETWENNAWKRISHTTYAYDGSNRLEVTTLQYDNGGVLVNASRTTLSYDGAGNLSTSVAETWTGSAWEPSWRTTYTYDGQNREILELNESYIGGVWQEFTTDTTKWSGDDISEVVHVDIFFGNQVSRDLYFYNHVLMTEEVIHQDWNPALSAGLTADWENASRDFTVYEEYSTGVLIESEPWSPHYELGQNYPNPFNPTTVIHYSLHRSTDVTISVYNVLGQHVITLEAGLHDPGVYETRWNGADQAGQPVASGVYFYRLTTDTRIETRKMLLLK